jgi:hypothetical protein
MKNNKGSFFPFARYCNTPAPWVVAMATGDGMGATGTSVALALKVVFPVASGTACAVVICGCIVVVVVAGRMVAGATAIATIVGAVNAGGGTAQPLPLTLQEEPTIWAIRCGGTAAAAIAACCIARAVMVSLYACWALADPVVGAGCARDVRLAPGDIPCIPWTATCIATAAAC